MTETNIILKIVCFEYVEPSITVDLIMSKRSDALDIADKLNDIAKARKENTTTYIVQTIELPNGDNDSEDSIPF
jgi:hypothetical protein|tara:strand:- start:1172 stop:1393 length:222 start_codon:yes stop_codon:yes gene_type:complete